MNPMNFLQLKPAWERFKSNHPKLSAFAKAASREGFIDEGSIIEIKITNSLGQTLSSNVRVRQDDLEFFKAAKDIYND